MASTIAFYTGDGATTDFTVPFDYLAKKFVRVSLGVTILKGGDYGDTSKDYYFLDKTKVRLKVPPQEGEVLTIRRYTSATDRVVSFKDASVLKATDLDVSSVQTIHIAEEARDIINDALLKDKKGNWDAKGNRIVNVGAPEADSDAITYGVYKADAMGAYQAKLDAEAARDAAKVSETNAKASEVNAKESEVTAKASAGTAVSAAKHADAVKTENQAILEEARQLQTNIETSESNAYDNAVIATQKAEEAKVSERNAKVSEVNAKASEVEAKRQADLAKGYAENAASGQLNADWEATDPKSKEFIKNKPTLGTLSAKNSLAYSELTGVPTSFTPSSHTHPISQITNLQVDLTSIRESITNVSSKVDGIGDTLSPTYAKKQGILDACDKALNGANPVHAGDPTLDEIKSALATIQAQLGQLGQLESRRYVKETGNSSDGTSWYRKWSDGWIEQGGITQSARGATSRTINLSTTFSSSNYFVVVQSYTGGASDAKCNNFHVTKKSLSSFSAVAGCGEDVAGLWYACGY